MKVKDYFAIWENKDVAKKYGWFMISRKGFRTLYERRRRCRQKANPEARRSLPAKEGTQRKTVQVQRKQETKKKLEMHALKKIKINSVRNRRGGRRRSATKKGGGFPN